MFDSYLTLFSIFADDLYTLNFGTGVVNQLFYIIASFRGRISQYDNEKLQSVILISQSNTAVIFIPVACLSSINAGIFIL